MAEEENFDAATQNRGSSHQRKRTRVEEEEAEDEVVNVASNNNNNGEIIVPEAKRAHGAPVQDPDLMALLDRIDKMEHYQLHQTDGQKSHAEEEMSFKDSSSSNGDLENELNFNFIMDELDMNYFHFCDGDLTAVYPAMPDYTEVCEFSHVGSLWEDDIWQVKDVAHATDVPQQEEVRYG